MTRESGEYRSRVTQGIQQIALTKLVGGFNSKVSSLGCYPGENSNCALFHGGFLPFPGFREWIDNSKEVILLS